MAEFQTFDLGRVLQTAEAIKGMRREAENDRLRNEYMGTQAQVMRDSNVRAQEDQQAQRQSREALRVYHVSDAVLRSDRPLEAIRNIAPDFVKDFESQHGAGSFAQLSPEKAKELFGYMRDRAASVAGIQQGQEQGFTLSEGQVRFGPGGQPIAQVAPKPQKTPARFRPMTAQEVQSAGLPPGTAAQVNDDTGQISVLSKRDASSTLSQKDATVAKQKLTTITLARQQLQNIQQRFKNIKDSFSAGPGGQGLNPTAKGQAFDRAVDQMRSTLTALTKVPGIGAMSDYETRLDQSKFPNRSDYEEVTQQQINDIAQMLQTLEGGYKDLLGGGTAQGQQDQENDVSALSDEDLLKALNGG